MSSRHSASLHSSLPLRPLNQPNRRVRTRTHGDVGGEKPKGLPLSRFAKVSRGGPGRCALLVLWSQKSTQQELKYDGEQGSGEHPDQRGAAEDFAIAPFQ